MAKPNGLYNFMIILILYNFALYCKKEKNANSERLQASKLQISYNTYVCYKGVSAFSQPVIFVFIPSDYIHACLQQI